MIFGESDLRNPLWSILSVFLYFLGLQQKGQLVELAARQGQNNHKALWKELKFPCCFLFLGRFSHKSWRGVKKRRKCCNIGPLFNLMWIWASHLQETHGSRSQGLVKGIWYLGLQIWQVWVVPLNFRGYVDTFGCHEVLFFEAFECPTFHIPWCRMRGSRHRGLFQAHDQCNAKLWCHFTTRGNRKQETLGEMQILGGSFQIL